MLKTKLALTGLAFLFTLCTFAQQAQYIPGDLMIMMAPGASAEKVAADLASVDGQSTELRVAQELSAPMRAWLLQFDHEKIAQHVMLRAVNAHPDVMLAQNNHIVEERLVPNDTQYGQQWHHQNIASETAWDITTGGLTATGDTIVVCIIERADLPHPDLIDNAWFNHAEIPNNGIDDDDNGYVDDHRGWNPPNNNDNVYGGSHGTQVAGMIGAKGNNNEGVAGANWDVKMMVVNYGGTQEAQVVAAYTYPLLMRRRYNETNGAEGAFVVATNASWGINYGQPSQSPLWCAMYDTLGTEGILSCGATANLNINIDVEGDLPTACPSEYLVSVTATDVDDIRTFSAYGLTHVDVGAPGEDVRTTNMGGGYGTTSGTSFASPLTAGVIGLLYSAPCASMMDLVHADPAAGAQFVRDALFNGVDMVGNLAGQTVTGGRINASNSIGLIMSSCGACPSPYNISISEDDLVIGSATLSWSSVNGNTFEVRFRPVGTPDWTVITDVTSNEITIDGLLACVLYEFEVMAFCDDDEQSEWSQTFTWTSEGCCEMPADITVSGITETSATLDWGTVLAAATYDLRYREVGTSEWTMITGITVGSSPLTGLQACTNYEVQGQSICDGMTSEWTASVLFVTVGCGACTDLEFCGSISEDSSDEHIAAVVIGSLNNESGDDGGYGDYTDLTTPLDIGATYTISLTPGYGGFFNYQEHFRVWMDLDQDGTFTMDEMVYDAPNTTNTTITGQITIPETTVPGPARMRVVMRYNSAVPGPCVIDYDYGETEDYCVLFVPATAMPEHEGSIGINVFPDPADRDIFFDITGPIANAPLLIKVLDTSGREVATRRTQGGRATITTAFLANGMYAYQVLHGDQELGRGRFIVAHP